MFVKNSFIFVIFPVAQEVVSLFWNGYIFILLLNTFVASVILFDAELPVQNQDFETSILVKENKAAFLSGKASPNDVVQFKISDKGIVKLPFTVKPNFSLQCYNSHLLSFELQKFSFERLLSQFESVFLSHKFKITIGDSIVSDCLISSN